MVQRCCCCSYTHFFCSLQIYASYFGCPLLLFFCCCTSLVFHLLCCFFGLVKKLYIINPRVIVSYCRMCLLQLGEKNEKEQTNDNDSNSILRQEITYNRSRLICFDLMEIGQLHIPSLYVQINEAITMIFPHYFFSLTA